MKPAQPSSSGTYNRDSYQDERHRYSNQRVIARERPSGASNDRDSQDRRLESRRSGMDRYDKYQPRDSRGGERDRYGSRHQYDNYRPRNDTRGRGPPRERQGHPDYNRNDQSSQSSSQPYKRPENNGLPSGKPEYTTNINVTVHKDLDAGLSKEELISKYDKKLRSVIRYPTLEHIEVIGSKWGIKPKGFENVTAQRAKLSGLFPLPGYPRPVDFTNKIDYLKVVEFLNKFLNKVDCDETSMSNNIESKRMTTDDRNMIIEFKNNTCATIAYSLKGMELSSAEFAITEHKNEDEEQPEANEDKIDETKFVLDIARPGEYVVQCLSPYKEIKEDEVEDKVIDSPRSKDPLGIAFVEFYIDPQEYSRTIKALPVLDKMLAQVNELSIVTRAFYSCLTTNEKGEAQKTSIQDCPIDFHTLQGLVRNEFVTTHPKLRVIQLLNIVTAKDLVDDENFNFIKQDILQEVSKLGKIKSIKIPRPANDYTPGIVQFSQPGLGKIYLEFEEEEIALNAIMNLAGRSYNDRTLLCAFYDYDDFKNGLL
ncbi:hypothetical protein QCA50_012846 [Cerrena zonata]|uniref:Uncharacterized protein n=1 Tax=Cerrena zonata TaxID=2478898 RepID=A0AAW0G484_9APHY